MSKVTQKCQECVDLYPGSPCPKHAVPLPAPDVVPVILSPGSKDTRRYKAARNETPPETRAKTLDEVENWYWAYGYMFWQKDGSSRDAIRLLRKILFPNGGGDVS